MNKNGYEPTISVITVVFNGASYLENCIKSIIGQTYESLEYLVIDGGSTDGSIKIIRKYVTDIDFWISEPDKGISDAMNKGVAQASGEYVVFIHADDYLYTDTAIEKVVKHLSPTTDILIADILFGKDCIRRKSRGINFWLNLKMGLYHQGVLCRRLLFSKYGGFDEKMYITMDYDFFLRLYRHGIRAKHCDEILSVMGDQGISSRLDWTGLSARFYEEEMIHKKNCNSLMLKIFYCVYEVLYIRYRRILYEIKI